MPKVSSRQAQRRTLLAFQAYVKREGRPPSIRELSAALGLRPLSVQRQLNRLIDCGFILARTTTVRRARAISAAGQRWLEENEKE